MSGYRIVFNRFTGKYRVERRSWLGWAFVMDADGTDYVTFDDQLSAERFVCAARQARPDRQRRWQVIDTCCRARAET